MSLHQMRTNVDNHSIGGYRAMMAMQSDSDSVHGAKDAMMATMHGVPNPSMAGEMLPKKRGRKKKSSMDDGYVSPTKQCHFPGIESDTNDSKLSTSRMSTPFSMASEPVANNIKQIAAKERKKHDRFNGMTEEEVSKRTLPDHLADNLDIIIVSVIFVHLLFLRLPSNQHLVAAAMDPHYTFYNFVVFLSHNI